MEENLQPPFGRAHGHWSGVRVTPEDRSLLYSADVIITLSSDSPLSAAGNYAVYAANNGTGVFAIKFAPDGSAAIARDGEIQARLIAANPDELVYLAHGGTVRNPRSFDFYPDLSVVTSRVDAVETIAADAGCAPFALPPDTPPVRALGFRLAAAMESLKRSGKATPDLCQEESAIAAALVKPRRQETARLLFLEALARAPRSLGFETMALDIIRQDVGSQKKPSPSI